MRENINEVVIFEASPHLVSGAVILFFCGVLFWLIIPLVAVVYEFYRLRSIEYTITNQRIKISSGIFFKKTDQMELYRLKDMRITKTPFQRFFNVGTLEVISTDKTSPICYVESIPNVDKLVEDIRVNVEQLKGSKRRIY